MRTSMVSCGTPTIRRRLAVAAPIAMLVAFPAGAHAVDPGVNYDPASPAGKEYAIPLAQGRAEGAGTQDQQRAADTPFGIGITPPGASGGAGGDGSTAGTPGGEAGSAGQAGGAARSPEDAAALRSRIGDAEDAGGTAAQWTFGIALALALTAALLTFVLRERQQHRLG